MYKLPKLKNIIDDIKIVDNFYLNEKEIEEFIETTIELMYNFIEENPKLIAEEDFLDIFEENISEIIFTQYDNDLFFGLNDDAEDDIEFLLEYCFELFFEIYPKRQEELPFLTECECCNFEIINKNIISKKIKLLSDIYQPQQRTTEWYNFRHNLITASNAFKCFENGNTINQLIYEKCSPIVEKNMNININSPMHWGQKFEPISVMLYENMFGLKVSDYGCIKHSKYNFLGASPDGIVVDEKSPYYGFMLEIKNPVSRVITGIPKREYWVQCQLQLECCDLEYCHFLETSFVEYESEEEFKNDGNDFLTNNEGNKKGIFIFFSTSNGPYYVYKPINMGKIEFEKWLEKNIDENIGKTFVKLIYWKLSVLSCVLVKRNRIWFKNNINGIAKIWDIIIEERENLEYEKRAPNKRTKSEIDEKDEKIINICQIKIDKENRVNLLNTNIRTKKNKDAKTPANEETIVIKLNI